MTTDKQGSTPEVDAFYRDHPSTMYTVGDARYAQELGELARKLERERDEARAWRAANCELAEDERKRAERAEARVRELESSLLAIRYGMSTAQGYLGGATDLAFLVALVDGALDAARRALEGTK